MVNKEIHRVSEPNNPFPSKKLLLCFFNGFQLGATPSSKIAKKHINVGISKLKHCWTQGTREKISLIGIIEATHNLVILKDQQMKDINA